MAKSNVTTIVIRGDSSHIEKALENTARHMQRTQKQSKNTKKELKSMGDGFIRASNNVSIFNGQLDPISGRLSAIGTGLNRFGLLNVAGAAAVGAGVIAISKMVSGLETWEKRQNSFNQLLRATSFAARLTRKDLEDLAQQTARNTLGSVDETAVAIKALTTFKSVQDDVFRATIRLGTDSVAAFGGNLRETIVAFGKALNDPIANLGALSRKGIQFTNTQKDMITTLAESGRLHEAQLIIISELRSQFGGLAAAEAPALAGSMDSLSQSVDNMFESLGRTGFITGLRDGFSLVARGADHLAQRIADVHSLASVEQRRIAELVDAENKASKQLMFNQSRLADAQRIYEQSLKTGTEASIKDSEMVLQQREREELESLAFYKRQAKALGDHIVAKRKLDEKDRNKFKQGVLKSLNLELDAIKDQGKVLKSEMDKRRNSLVSAFESERDKVNRVFTQKTQDYTKSYNKQIQVIDSGEKKQIEILEKSGASYKEIRDFEVEIAAQRLELKEGFDGDMTRVEDIRQLKLDAVTKREEARETAKLMREERATAKITRATLKRNKLLAGIRSDESVEDKLREKYIADVVALSEAEFTKTEWVREGVNSRVELVALYGVKLAETYAKDLKKFKTTEASKTASAMEQAALRSKRKFKDAAKGAEDSAGESVGSFYDFFGGEDAISTTQDKLAAIKEVYVKHLADIEALGVGDAEKAKRREAVNAEFKKNTEELSKEGSKKAHSDTWDALSTLATSGSRKMFAIDKAMRISKAVMSTYAAASNAMAEVPYPFNFLAAGLVTAAGYANVRAIKAEKMPQAHDGIDNVPRTGTYLLEGGERVLDGRLNADLKDYLKGRDNGGGGAGKQTNVTFTVPNMSDYDNMQLFFDDNIASIARAVQFEINED